MAQIPIVGWLRRRITPKECARIQDFDVDGLRGEQFTLADSNAHPHSGEPIWWQDTLVGRTTSGAFGHTLGCAIALGYIRIAEQGLDAMLSTGGFEIEIACQRFPAQATLEAAYDSENLKPRM